MKYFRFYSCNSCPDKGFLNKISLNASLKRRHESREGICVQLEIHSTALGSNCVHCAT